MRRLELPTSRLSGVRSNRLSYKPIQSGSHLLSHAVSSIVPSAARVLTIVFGMRTGVSPKRIATGIFKLFVSPPAMRFAHSPPEDFVVFVAVPRPPDSRQCFASARARPFALFRLKKSHSFGCKHPLLLLFLLRSTAPWQLDSNATPTSSVSLERR